jgi:hypothetical protein
VSKRRVVNSALDKMQALREVDCKMLIRVDGFIFAGIVSKIKRIYDSQIGKDRRWALGATIEGKMFEEPLDRKNPKSGRLEDCIQRETEYMIITARRSFDAKDTDDNFTWLPHQFSMDEMKTLQDEVDVLRRTNNRVTEQIGATEKHMALLETDAHNTAEQNNVFRETLRKMSSVMNTLEMENQGMYTLLQRLRAHGLEVEGELAVELARALDKGKERAQTAHELKMGKFKEDEEERQHIHASFPYSYGESVKNIIETAIDKAVDKKTIITKQSTQAPPKQKAPVSESETSDEEATI